MQDEHLDPDQLRAKVADLKEQAQATDDPTERENLLLTARTYLLMATNAAWIRSTDDFLKAVEAEQPWPQPHLAEDQRRGAKSPTGG